MSMDGIEPSSKAYESSVLPLNYTDNSRQYSRKIEKIKTVYNRIVLCPVMIYNEYMPVFKSVNKTFFKQWSSEMAYVLGFFAADGYITVNKRGGQFWCISITDGSLLNEIKRIIQSEHKISFRKGIGNERNQYRIQIGSIEMCDDLRKLGFTERKTKVLSVPVMPDKYFRHFVRGYFDGDGHVWSGLVHKDRKTKTITIQSVFTSCSYQFLDALRFGLDRKGIKKGVLRKGKGNYYRLTYSVLNSLKLYDFMYNSLGTSRLFLKRKKDVFEKYIQMRP